MWELGTTHDGHLLPCSLPEHLGPPDLPRVPLHLEVLVALALAEDELLCVVAHEHHPATWVDGAGAEVAVIHSDHLAGLS